MVKINLMPKKTWKTKVLKGLNIVAQVALVIQMSSLGVFLVPTAQAATPPAIDGLIDASYSVHASVANGTLYKFEDASYIYFAMSETRNINDNVYSENDPDVAYDGWNKHKFKDLIGSDRAQFVLADGNFNTVVDVTLDYLHALVTGSGKDKVVVGYDSGVCSPGPGIDKCDYSATTGAGFIVDAATSLDYDINSTTFAGRSPIHPAGNINPHSPFPEDANWEYNIIYEFKIDKAALGGNGFGALTTPFFHNSPAKQGEPDTIVVPGIHKFVNGVEANTADPGETLNYTINYFNADDNDTLHNVVITDVVDDPFLTYVVSSCAGGISCSYDAPSKTITWQIGNLLPQTGGTVSFQATIDDPMPVGTTNIYNDAVIDTTETDPATSNEVVTTVTVEEPGECDLLITKKVTDDNETLVTENTASVGETLTYTIEYENIGSSVCTGTGVKVYDPLDNNLTYVPSSKNITIYNDGEGDGYHSTQGNDYNGIDKTLLYNVNRVSPGESGIITFDVTVNQQEECGNFDIPNKAKIWSNQTGYLWSNQTLTHVLMDCYGSLKVYKYVDSGSATPDQWDFTIASEGTLSPNLGENFVVFDQLTPGIYTVTESALTDYHQVSTTCNDVNVVVGQQASCNFHNARDTGNISGKKYEDKNSNGTWDNGEPFLSGWTIFLDYDRDGELDNNEPSRVTDSKGYYEFTNLPTGDYTVAEVVQNGWANTSGNPVPASVTADQTTTVDFGNFKKVNITLCKYEDMDGNLQTTDDQNPVSSWGLWLEKNDHYFKSHITKPNGCYTWYDLEPGEYTGFEETPSNWTALTPTSHNFGKVISGNSYNYTFINTRDTGLLIVNKEIDIDGDGKFEGGNPEANNLGFRWGINDEDPDREMGTDKTLTTGSYQITENDNNIDGYHFVGWYKIERDSGSSCENPEGKSLPVNVNIEKNVATEIVLCNARDTAHLTLEKIVDNHWGGEAVPSNWTLKAEGPSTLEGNGGASGKVLTGTYTLSESGGPDGYSASDWSCEGGELNGNQLTLGLGENVTCEITNDDIPGKIYGYKYDTSETGLAEWEICLDGNFDGNNELITAVSRECVSTDENGYYEFTGLYAGTYDVVETMKDGWQAVDPASEMHEGIIITPGASFMLNFINEEKAPGVNLTKTIIDSGLTPGGFIEYRLDYENTGNVTLTGVTIVDDYREDLVTLSDNPFSAVDNGNTLTWSRPDLAVGASDYVTYRVSINEGIEMTTEIPNTATIYTNETDPVEDDEIVEVPVPVYEINLTKTDTPDPVSPGAIITYTLTWSVGGDTGVTDLTLTDTLPVEVIFYSASNNGNYNENNHAVTWNLGDHEPGDNGAVELTVKVKPNTANGTVIHNVAVLDSNETEEEEADEDTLVEASPILNIEKTVDLAYANPGNVVTYTVVITNTGNETAYNVVLTDTLPDGFTYVETGKATRTWSLGNLEPGASTTVNYEVTVGNSVTAGLYDNVAEAEADNHGKVSDVATVEVRIPTVLGEEPQPMLLIEKTVDRELVDRNSLVNYTVTILNDGEGSAFDVVLTDTLPAGFTFTDTGLSTKTWEIGLMLPGSQIVFNYEVLVGNDAERGAHDNLAVASASNHEDVSDKATVQVKVGVVLGLAEAGLKYFQLFYVLLSLFFVSAGLSTYKLIRRRDILIK